VPSEGCPRAGLHSRAARKRWDQVTSPRGRVYQRTWVQRDRR
jgi:hypothetical protein